MNERLPVNILFICVVFLFVIYLTGAIDLAVTAALITASLLFKFPSVWLFLSSLTVFAFYLVTIFLSLKIKFITDFSVSAYLLFASGLVRYFLEGQKSSWIVRLPIIPEIKIERADLIKIAAILLFVYLIYPLTGAYFGAIFGYLAYLYIFKKTEGRYAFTVALFFLILCPFLLIAKKEKIAEKSAIFTYYFLVIGVIQEIIDMFINPAKPDQEPIDQDSGQMAGFVYLKHKKRIIRKTLRNLRILLLIFVIILLSSTGYYFTNRFLIKNKKLKLDFKIFSFGQKKESPEIVETVLPSHTPTPALTISELKNKIAGSSFDLKVSVLNGTDIALLASSTSAKLKEAGFKNIVVSNAPGDYLNWQLSIKEKEDNLVEYLKQILKLSQLEVNEASKSAKYDLEIIAGINSE